MRHKVGSFIGGIIAAAAWYALALQLSILLRDATDWIATIVTFFAYFTILTNTLVALVLTIPAIPFEGSQRFASPNVRTAAVVYIAIVGIVYAVVLQDLWNPRGAQAVADLILHKLVPALYVAYWLLFEPHGRVAWRAALAWLTYPVAYVVYSLLRGGATGWYPYPFLDVPAIGIARVLINSMVLLGVFLLLSAFVIAVDKLAARQR